MANETMTQRELDQVIMLKHAHEEALVEYANSLVFHEQLQTWIGNYMSVMGAVALTGLLSFFAFGMVYMAYTLLDNR